jgi:hypothetical protein
VIIITGPGRSGTSVLAKLYKELGFDPGGNWIPKARAGLEHGDFWRLNNKLAAAIGATMLAPPRPPKPPPPATGYRRGVRAAQRRAVASPLTARALGLPPQRLTGQHVSRVRLINWNRVPAVVEEHREAMVKLARETVVVKDPRFMWTLPLWLAAGAEIEHVTITFRAMEDMVASRHAAGHSNFTATELRNSLTYGVGVITAAVKEHDVSHSYIRFPDFVHDTDMLYAGLRFPEPVSPEHFRETAKRVFDPDQVHDYSAEETAS